jgi:hypothetical protein
MAFEEPAVRITPRAERGPSTCESCGEPFACGAAREGCWCTEVKLSEATRAGLRERFSRCLCRACLERFAVGESFSGEDNPAREAGQCGQS